MVTFNDGRKLVFRKKVLIVPYTRDGRFLFVKDKQTSEWGFISGGVKRMETYYNASCRELFEETSGLMKKVPDNSHRISFVHDYRPIELLNIDKRKKEYVRSIYTIFLFPINERKLKLQYFKPNKEIIDMCITYFDSLPKTWELSCIVYKYIKKSIFLN